MDEDLINSFKGKKVLVTGHTGFKGSWLTLWLKLLGAEVIGVALDPDHNEGAFKAMNISSLCKDIRQDINDLSALQNILTIHQPQVVFHLAAQPLVLDSYKIPIETFQTNIIGTANILETCRHIPSIRTIVVITTDKCYENIELGTRYKETDRLGGKDPYSASKASAELVVNSYRESFFRPETGVGLATVRAGNVIGGGDWASNRIVPDCIKALLESRPVEVRNPGAVRPWQFVLEPLRGYLVLASKLMKDPVFFSGPWNFGPGEEGKRSVNELVTTVLNAWSSGSQTITKSPNQAYEAQMLALDISKARTFLKWEPLFSFNQSIKQTVEWYKAQAKGDNMQDFGLKQIRDYQNLLK